MHPRHAAARAGLNYFHMISRSLIPEFDHEMPGTRKHLERIPEDQLDYKPHPKSFSLGQLAQHLATIPSWAVVTINQDEIDLAGFKPPAQLPKQEILDLFDKNVAAAHEAIASATDETWVKPWTLKHGDKVLMTMPKIAVLRTFVLTHNVHHRAQLGVYLRLLDVSVPAIIGPSADEGQM